MASSAYADDSRVKIAEFLASSPDGEDSINILERDVMPKMKTNRMMYKKFRVGGTGRAKKAQARTSHNTGKKSAKRMRHLKGSVTVDRTNIAPLKRALPYAGIR